MAQHHIILIPISDWTFIKNIYIKLKKRLVKPKWLKIFTARLFEFSTTINKTDTDGTAFAILARAFLRFMALAVYSARGGRFPCSPSLLACPRIIYQTPQLQRHVNNTNARLKNVDARWLVGYLRCPWPFCLLTHISNVSSRHAEDSKSKHGC